ncbi:MAG: hypothetical protein BroJett003_18770 [Planctomycetota bacterium]|nr:MAG: hypothetical protein BroJett003_18770 [Planctomycetota bacterium]
MILRRIHLALPIWVTSLFLSAPSPAQEEAAILRRWVERTARVDSLYVEGRFVMFRSPVEADIDDQSQWVSSPDFPSAEFKIWLRRPDFRIWMHAPEHGRTAAEIQEFSWLEGRLVVTGDLQNIPPDQSIVSIVGVSRRALLSFWPYLTPLEYHFFDWEIDNYPSKLLKRPRRTEGTATVVELTRVENWGSMLARIEFNPDNEVPKRLTSLSGDDPERRITWDMVVLETRTVDDVPVISKARFALYNPNVLRDVRSVYLYETTRIEKRPITRADLEIRIPEGVQVNDFVNEKVWIAGQEDSAQDLDREEFRKAAQAVQAQLVSPEIRAARKSAMTWIVGLGVGVGVVLTAMGLYIRRLRRG